MARITGPVNEDLIKERATGTFNVRELTYLIRGGKEATERFEEIHEIVANDPLFRKDDLIFLSREQAYKRGLQKSAHFVHTLQKLKAAAGGKWTEADEYFFTESIDDVTPFELHRSMFLPTLEGQLDEEQKKKWLPLAYNYGIVGTYAQTEMGHGTNLRGLETTATYDREREEWVINSPTLSSTKWWPGCLGKTSNFCVIMAQLLVGGENKGPHPFIIQLRSLEDHSPLPGVTIGDIGPKVGYTANDNGFLRLNHVRIPRDHMLMRYATVSKEGVYSKPLHAKLAYGTMMRVRLGICANVGKALARAAVIAARYSTVRRQGNGHSGTSERELQVIEYKTQQHRVMSAMATAYAFQFAGQELFLKYLQLVSDIQLGDVSKLGDFHGSTCSLKSYMSWACVNGIESCRQSLGGHGYSHFSGIPRLYNDMLPACTYEGENVVMCLQTGRFLIKQAGEYDLKGPKAASEDLHYMLGTDTLRQQSRATSAADFADSNVQLAALRYRASFILHSVKDLLKHATTVRKLSFDDAFNAVSNDLVRLSLAHAELIVAEAFLSKISKVDDLNIRIALKQLANVYILNLIIPSLGELMEGGYLKPAQSKFLRQAYRDALDAVRPNVVPFADAWGFSDFYLESSLGRYDGQVYPNLYARAQESNLNVSDKPDGIDESLLPLLKEGREIAAKESRRSRL